MSKDSEGFSLKFALKMVQMADRPDLVWLNYEVRPYPDDDPTKLRHLSVRVERQNFFDIEAECFVHRTEQGWIHGSVRVGHYGEAGQVYTYDPEEFFEYHHEQGMYEVRKVPVEIIKTSNGYTARALEENPDVTPSVRDGHRMRELPFAIAKTENEALGALVKARPDLFRIVIRHAQEPVGKISDLPPKEALQGTEGKQVKLILRCALGSLFGIVNKVGDRYVCMTDPYGCNRTTAYNEIKKVVLFG